MNDRALALAGGLVATAVGLAMVAVPQLAVAVPTDRDVLLLVGGLALGGALLSGLRTDEVIGERFETGDPETLADLPAPGDEDSAVFRERSVRRIPETREKVVVRLRSVAVEVVQRRHDCSPAAARAMVAAGEWTADPYAAAFLAEEADVESPNVPARARIRTDGPLRYRARRTLDAIVDLAGMEVPA